MKRSLVPLACAVLALPLGGAPDAAVSPTPAELIERLGSESYPEREQATVDLWWLGDKASKLLEQASASGNPEVALRARTILRQVRLGILPDSPPEVVALVRRYDRAKPSDRQRIIRELKALGAWRQVLHIHALETDPETLRQIAPEMPGVAVEAARQVLAAEPPDFAAAREMLEMGQAEPSQLIALAEFHRVAGSIDAEMERAAALEGRAGHLWRYALHAAKGEHAAAAEEAAAAGEEDIAARLRLVMGDPRDWLESVRPQERQVAPLALDAYREAAIGLWSGKPVPDNVARAIAGIDLFDDEEEAWNSTGILFALGEKERGERMLTRLSPATAFSYFEAAEDIDKALAVFDLDPAKPDYAGWAQRRWRVVIGDYDEVDSELFELRVLGLFLERRGLHEELDGAFREPLEELAGEDSEVFIEVVGELFGGQFGLSSTSTLARPVIAACATFAEGDDGRWAAVRDALFGRNVHVGPLWESLTSFQAELGGTQRLRLMTGLLGFPGVAEEAAGDWWEWARVEARKGNATTRGEWYGLLLALCQQKPDAARFLEVLDEAEEAGLGLDDLGRYSREFGFSVFRIDCLAVMERWDQVAEFWRQQVEEEPTDPAHRACLEAALRQAGREEEATKQGALVERLALGDAVTMMRIGRAYSTYGDSPRAFEWWSRGIGEVTSDSQLYGFSGLLGNEAKWRSDWKLAASLSEVFGYWLVMRADYFEEPSSMLRMRVEVEMMRALSRLGTEPEAAMEELRRCEKLGAAEGPITDYFFPALRAAGRTRVHDEWFEKAWAKYQGVLKRFPGSHNTMNTAAWTAARANRRLDEAEELVREALEGLPNQAPYLDTYGEIWFCRGDREKALEWSGKAVRHDPSDSGLTRQQERFRDEAFPLD